MLPRIDLHPERQENLHGGRPDYLILAGTMTVGRIYLTLSRDEDQWFWGLNGVVGNPGIALNGQAVDLKSARVNIRAAFDKWLAWALTVPSGDLKFTVLDAHLRRMGAR
jgi:hypothetical protein